MDITGYRRLTKVLFYIGAMLAFFGLGFYLMEYQALGIVVLIIGIVLLVLAFVFIRFFTLIRYNETMKRR